MSDDGIDGSAISTPPEEASSLRMVATLGAAGALAGLLIVGVFTVTLPPIEAHKAEVLRLAISEVLNGPARYETLYATPQGIFESPPPAGAEKIYIGLDANSVKTGVAIKAAAAGFQDVITLIYGFDPATGRLLGIKVLESRETPGLGDKIEKEPHFIANFEKLEAALTAAGDALLHPIVTVKQGEKEEPWQIDGITGATITSEAIGKILNDSANTWAPVLEREARIFASGETTEEP